MTRAQMNDRVVHILGEWDNTPGGQNPVLIDEHIIEATNTLATECYAFYQRVWQDITYVDPTDPTQGISYTYQMNGNVDKPKYAFVNDASGQLYQLVKITPGEMDALFSTAWRQTSTAATGTPHFFVQEAANLFSLYPRPNYVTNCQCGVSIEGYFVPGSQWDASLPADDPGQDDAECPLPLSAHYGVIWQSLITRSVEIFNPDAKPRIEMYQMLLKPYKEDLEIKSATVTQAMRGNWRYPGIGNWIYAGSGS